MFTSLGKAGTVAILCVAALTLTAGAVGLSQWLAAQDEEAPPLSPAPPVNAVVAQNGDAAANRDASGEPEQRPELNGQGHNPPRDLLQVAMARLHQEAVQRCLSRPEQGMRRMIVLPKKIESEWKVPLWSPSEVTRESGSENKSDLARIHERSLQDFVNPNLAAAKKVVRPGDPEVVVFLKDELDRKKHKDWEIKSLDLLGLVKYDHPVVYVSEKLPDMKSLKDVPTRLLDFFEVAAVEELKKGEDLFIASKEGTVRVLGAIRAREECLRCHGGKQGDLLGGFSYTLRPARYVDPLRVGPNGTDLQQLLDAAPKAKPEP